MQKCSLCTKKKVCKWRKNAQKVEKNEEKFGGIKKTNYFCSPIYGLFFVCVHERINTG
jgi:hypothetical protein